MATGIESLTERERETLRLLLAGHDAKSIAREFDLSVHTINDRLRDVRRKLGVPSSREAARMLSQVEGASPNFVAPKEIGVGGSSEGVQPADQPGVSMRTVPAFVWLGGGLLMLSLVAVAIILNPFGTESVQPNLAARTQVGKPSTRQAESASVNAARAWLALVDGRNWAESWNRAGSMFQSQISQQAWASTIAPVRAPLGSVASRSLGKVTQAASLPGAPAGEYELLEFQTNFANKRGAVETVVLAKQGSAWRVVGYFIR